MLKRFTIEELARLADGKEAHRINNAIEAAARDCNMRPGLDSARSVTIKLEMKPVQGEEGYCETVDVDVVTSLSLPKSRSATFSMATNLDGDGRGELHWNDASRDNPRQGTLDEAKAT